MDDESDISNRLMNNLRDGGRIDVASIFKKSKGQQFLWALNSICDLHRAHGGFADHCVTS